MTILEWLLSSMQKLKQAGVDSPRRDALVLLEDTLGKDRSWVISHPEFLLQGSTLQEVNKSVIRRTKREPLAYIRGKAWFYGRFFDVTPSVLIPRPESESFIEQLKEIKPTTLVDIGTGSGCLAVTAKLEFPECEVIATDIDSEALKIAEQNAQNHEADIQFIKSDLLDSKLLSQNWSDRTDYVTVFVANLPYVPSGLVTSPEIKREPALALFSGEDGLDHYQKFWQQINDLSVKPRYVLVESLETQHQKQKVLAEQSGYKLEKTEILVQQFKKI